MQLSVTWRVIIGVLSSHVYSSCCYDIASEELDYLSLLQTSTSVRAKGSTQERGALQQVAVTQPGSNFSECKQGKSLKHSNFRLPHFESYAALQSAENSKWLAYLETLYGPMLRDKSIYPIDVSTFWVLNQKQLSIAGLEVPVTECPQRELSVFSSWDHNPKDFVHILHKPPFEALPSNSWVEVTHCQSDVTGLEENAYWMYYAPGSGVFYNLGETKVFQYHNDAIEEFVGSHYRKKIEQPDIAPPDAERIWKTMYREAAKSYTSLQFVRHNDQVGGADVLEIVDLHHSGKDVCSLPIAGAFGQCSCACNKIDGFETSGISLKSDVKCLSCDLDCSSAPQVTGRYSSLRPPKSAPV